MIEWRPVVIDARKRIVEASRIEYLAGVTVLIQQLETELFLGKNGGWVEEQGDARPFPTSAEAIVYCVKEKLKEVRVAMLFGDATMDLYYYPSQSRTAGEELQKSQEESQRLREKQKGLVKEVKANVAALARQVQQLPLKRKKKRERPAEEE